MGHDIVHDLIELLKVVLRARARQCHHKLICELVHKVVAFSEELAEVSVEVERVWQVLGDQLQVVVILNVDGALERIGRLSFWVGDEGCAAGVLDKSIDKATFSFDELFF